MQLAELIKDWRTITIEGKKDIEISGISIDSKNIQPNNIFVCIKGYKTDGHNFIQEVLQKGIKVIVVENNFQSIFKEEITLIKVENTRKFLSYIADKFYNSPSTKLKVIGITGTNGKTTTSFMTDFILSKANFRTGLISTVLYRIEEMIEKPQHTTPDAIKLQSLFYQMVNKKIQFAIMEVSSHSLFLNRVDDVNFDIAVFMNLTQDHLDFHQDILNYRLSKMKLFELLNQGTKSPKFAIINIDDPNAFYFIKNITSSVITFGIEQNADIKAEKIKMNLTSSSFVLKTKEEEKEVKLNLIGKFNIYNSLATIAICKACNIDINTIIQCISEFSAPAGRFEKIDCGQDFIVIIDYAHTPDALQNVLTTIKSLKKEKIITVFGCGGNRDRTKRPLMGEIAAKLSDYIIITSDNPRTEDPLRIMMDIEIGVNKVLIDKTNYQKILDRSLAIKEAINLANKDDVVLIAGKGHEDYQIFGETTIHFNDREEIEKFLKEK